MASIIIPVDMLPRPTGRPTFGFFSSLEFDKDARHVESRPCMHPVFRIPNSKNVIFTYKYIDGGDDILTGSYLICHLFTGRGLYLNKTD